MTSLHLVYAAIPGAHFKQDLPANIIITYFFEKVKFYICEICDP